MRKPHEWDKVFLNICFAVAQRSKDDSTQCGAVLVDERRVIVSTGFNGPPPQIDDKKVPWTQRPEKYAYIIHAEENAMLFGMENRGVIAGSTLYCTHAPCADCILRIIRSGIVEVVIPSCHDPYPLSKYQVESKEVREKQLLPRLTIRTFDFIK